MAKESNPIAQSGIMYLADFEKENKKVGFLAAKECVLLLHRQQALRHSLVQSQYYSMLQV